MYYLEKGCVLLENNNLVMTLGCPALLCDAYD